tara:strand:- start:1500 stop:2960 length:1461 start_codon:yes stop_codon:yes gene_type:complete
MPKSFRLYNSLGKKKESFYSNNNDKVMMYVCGPTVYDLLHIGNFRGPIFFNFLRNWLENIGYSVTYVYNYTDIDDKIINKSKEEKISTKDISEKYISEFELDYDSLKIKKPNFTPRCTEHIDDIISFIADLINDGFAYESNKSVFFSIEKFKKYGKLSGKNIDDLLAGHRVDVNKDKNNPMDFVLWKPSEKGDPGWDSPWGFGRPGWHIECSAMSDKILGQNIDIHGGGIDLLFPHHENEIAQSESRSSSTFSNFWVHNNLINFDNQKMSKSIGNIIKGRDFIKKYNAEILKFIILSVHYRSVLNFNKKMINQTIINLIKIYSSLENADRINKFGIDESRNLIHEEYFKDCQNKADDFINNDLNTPGLFSVFFEMIRKFNSISVNKKVTPELKYFSILFKNFFQKYGSLLGLFQESKKEFLNGLNLLLLKSKKIKITEIEKKIEDRNNARKLKDYNISDKIRNELLVLGIEIKDDKDGKTSWSVKV